MGFLPSYLQKNCLFSSRRKAWSNFSTGMSWCAILIAKLEVSSLKQRPYLQPEQGMGVPANQKIVYGAGKQGLGCPGKAQVTGED